MQRQTLITLSLLICLSGLTAIPGARAELDPKLDPVERQLADYIEQNNASAEALLIESVNINSGSMNFAGVKAVADHLAPHFSKLGFKVRWLEGSSWGRAGHLVAEHHAEAGTPKLLLIGHLDTVFEPDSPFQTFTRLEDGRGMGPGIADMKGGNLIILQALRALHATGALANMNVTVVLTGDEELSGEPLALSKKAITDAAEWADIALGFENGDGNPATANISRRGATDWILTVTGKPSHSSQIFREDVGAGAIYEASRILLAFYMELQDEENLTFNPGRIVGGTEITDDLHNSRGTAFGKSNVVAGKVQVQGDLRAMSPEQLQRARERMQTIVAANLPLTQAEIRFENGYPPMAPSEGNAQLLKIYSEVSQDLGQGEVVAVNPRLAGAADVSFAAGLVDMALDGLGMSGEHGHTEDETAILAALPRQSQRAAVLMYRLTR